MIAETAFRVLRIEGRCIETGIEHPGIEHPGIEHPGIEHPRIEHPRTEDGRICDPGRPAARTNRVD